MRRVLYTGIFLVLLFLSAQAQVSMDAVPRVVQTSASSGVKVLAFNNNVASGNLMVVSYETFAKSGEPTIADTLTTSWTLTAVDGSTNSCGYHYIWKGVASSGGANTVTITHTGTSFVQMSMAEVTAVTSTVDAAVMTSWSGSGDPTSGSMTTTANGDFIFGSAHTCNSGNITAKPPLIHISNNSDADSMGSGYQISGTNGSYTVSFDWSTSSSGHVSAVAFKSASSLTVTTTALPDASTSGAYSAQLNAESGSGAYTWDITSGALPLGLSLSSGGAITGTPTFGNGGSSITFRVTDGASTTATKALTIQVGTSFSTVGFIQSHSGASGFSLGTVTSGNTMLAVVNAIGNYVATVSSSRITWSRLPLAPVGANGSGALCFFMGIVNSTGTDTLSYTPGPVALAIELSNVQPIFDEAAWSVTQGTGTGTVTSNSMTSPVSETLWAVSGKFSSGGSVTAQSPFTANTTSTSLGASDILGDGYYIGAASGSHTVDFAIVTNTTYWYIGLFGIRPAKSGTAQNYGGVRHRSVQD